MKLKSLFLCCLAFPFAVQANTSNQSEPKNTVRFSVEAEKEVDLDILQVKLFVQEEHNDLKTLHQQISTKLNATLAKIKANSAISIKSNDHTTRIRYNNQGRKNGWIERADFVLESKDFYALSQLVDEISGQLSIEYITAFLSAEAKEKLDDELSQAVLAKFKHKANLIKNGLQMKDYRILSLTTINPEEKYGIEARSYMAYEAESKMSTNTAVQIETGKTIVKQSLDAVIELIQD
ncbi:MAG: SIMPL domain-containing protein [Lonepinella koalarum]|nr:SIMPL domain-containing protein [Lonepinella koalarum]